MIYSCCFKTGMTFISSWNKNKIVLMHKIKLIPSKPTLNPSVKKKTLKSYGFETILQMTSEFWENCPFKLEVK